MAILVGITGPSGAGKSTLAVALCEALGKHKTVIISQDDYYRDLSHIPLEERKQRDFDDPSSVDLDLLAENLEHLKKGMKVETPCYDFTLHTRKKGEQRIIEPKEFVIVEGLLICSSKSVRDLLDLIVYVDAPPETRLQRRIRRDTVERGRTRESVEKQWKEMVEPATKRFLEPVKGFADLVVDTGEGLALPVKKIRAVLETLE